MIVNTANDTELKNNEIWLPIEGTYGRYEVSSYGAVRSLYHRFGTKGHLVDQKRIVPKLLKQGKCGKYLHIVLMVDGKKKQHYVHRLVLGTFMPVESQDSLTVNHLDFNPYNNHLENLEWSTQLQNHRHSVTNGRFEKCFRQRSQKMKQKWKDGTHPFLRPDVQLKTDFARRNKGKIKNI